MSLKKFLYPSDEAFNALSYRDQKKVKALTIGNVIAFSMFTLLNIILLSFGNFSSGIPMVFISLILVGSMTAVKNARFNLGSYFTTVALLIACAIIAFFTSYSPQPTVCYRIACFCLASGTLNFIITLKKRQLVAYLIASLVLLIASTLIVYTPQVLESPKEWIGAICINIAALLTGNIIMFTSFKSTNDIIEHSETEHKQAEENLNTITNVLNQVKESLNVGEKLNNAADNASTGVNQITNIYQTLIEETDNLTEETATIKAASDIVTEKTAAMTNSIDQQNSSLTEVSAAITEISANITNVNTIAEKRRQGMAEVTQLLDIQTTLIQKLVNDVAKVSESSKRIGDFVKTVETIAKQTNLLAMNASIEAAHSGEHGKGFSVIAQEIRKLSNETSINASKISETLSLNTEIVKETTNSVEEFAGSTRKSETEIRETLHSMEEILHGISEIDIGTREIMNSVNSIVGVAHDNAAFVNDVAVQINKQTDGISNITRATDSLKTRVGSIETMLNQISMAVNDVNNSATENKDVSSKIAELLE